VTPDGGVDTRERLLRVALRLFAEHGIDRISLKMISDEAGNRNKSAVGYHFESKQGLIDAVFRRLERDLGPAMTLAIARLESRREQGVPIQMSDVVVSLLGPVFRLYREKPYGIDALRVLARLMHDPVDGVPRELRALSTTLIDRAVTLLHELMPDKPAALIQHHLHHAVMATVNGLALQQRFVSRHDSLWKRETLDSLFNSYAGYVVAGLSAMPLTLSADQTDIGLASGHQVSPAPVGC
jgi:AcrR family transcriptional regulator